MLCLRPWKYDSIMYESMSKELLKPTQNRYDPKDLIKSVADILELVNSYMTGQRRPSLLSKQSATRMTRAQVDCWKTMIKYNFYCNIFTT